MSFLLPNTELKIFYKKHQIIFGKNSSAALKDLYDPLVMDLSISSFDLGHERSWSFKGKKTETAKWIKFFRDQMEDASLEKLSRFGWIEYLEGRWVERFRWDMLL